MNNNNKISNKNKIKKEYKWSSEREFYHARLTLIYWRRTKGKIKKEEKRKEQKEKSGRR